jgi:hypothetical protein
MTVGVDMDAASTLLPFSGAEHTPSSTPGSIAGPAPLPPGQLSALNDLLNQESKELNWNTTSDIRRSLLILLWVSNLKPDFDQASRLIEGLNDNRLAEWQAAFQKGTETHIWDDMIACSAYNLISVSHLSDRGDSKTGGFPCNAVPEPCSV